ncbi:hypothetical protein [Halorubellus salinus]|uniref:hypothetical protein n=1 Tax=Halorubellus salinus TaxID=755309 RepID=UPI001D05F67C|nr:hypothetical protein [Halorubellus salinus]
MTENQRDADENATPMRAVSHTNPYTNESMGSVFEHGVTVVADGGRRDAVDEDPDAAVDADAAPDDEPFDDADAAPDDDAEDDADGTPMKDVSHEAPSGGHGNRMFERVGDTTDVTEE